MAAATSGSSPVRQFDPSPSDRLKSIEAKVVILGSQGTKPYYRAVRKSSKFSVVVLSGYATYWAGEVEFSPP